MVLGCAGCGRTAAESSEPPAPSSSSREVSQPADPSSAAPSQKQSEPLPSPSSAAEEESQPPVEVAPDPGTGAPAGSGGDSVRARVEAMVAYLKENLSPWDYTEVWFTCGENDGQVEIVTPSPDAAQVVAAAYPGETVPVEYTPAAFSKGQLDQAKADLTAFVADHPEIQVLEWAPILLFDGYRITLAEENSAVSDFIENYPVANIYQVTISPDGSAIHPD